MKTLVIKELVNNSSSREEGMVFYSFLNDAYINNETVLIEVDSQLSMSSSFLNASIGQFLDNYGIDVFKQMAKFKGSKNQFMRLSDYLDKYSNLYHV